MVTLGNKMGLKNFFRKFRKNGEVIDLATLHKKGILQKREDLIKEHSAITSKESPLGFLGNLASASDSSESGAIETTGDEAIIITAEGKSRIKGILRDMKLKIDNTYNRVYKLGERLDLLEKKIERLERRSGVEG